MSESNIRGVGSSGLTPEELAALQQAADRQKEAYLVSSELQYMISSLQTMANQLQNRIEESKQMSKEEASVGISSTASPTQAATLPPPGTISASDLANISDTPANLKTVTEQVLLSPAGVNDKATLLLNATTLDNAAQKLVAVATALKSALTSNVNPASMEAALQKILPAATSTVNQLSSAAEALGTAPQALKPAADALRLASQKLLDEIGTLPTTTADLPAFSQKLQTQLQSPTSTLMQVHLQYQQTANQVGGSLGVVLPSNKAAVAGPQHLGVPPKGVGAASPNPWSEVWKWIFGSQGIMNKVGSKMSELTKLLKNQSSAMKDFSGMLSLFGDLAAWGVPYHFNPSQNHADKTGWSHFQVAISNLKKHWTTLKADMGKVENLIKDLKSLVKNKNMTGFSKTLSQMVSNFYKMSNGFNVLKSMGTYQMVKTKNGGLTKHGTGPWRVVVSGTPPHTFITLVHNNPSISQWEKNANGSWKKVRTKIGDVFTHNGKPISDGKGMKFSSFINYQRGVLTKFNYNQQQFEQKAKDGGSNIQSLQTSTQSQIKLYMMYYQQIMQTGPSLVQTLNQLTMAVSANLRGGN